MSKKKYKPQFKAAVALEAIKGQKTTVEICANHKIPSTNLYEWRDKVLENAPNIFIPESEYTRQRRQLEQEIVSLHKIIGEQAVELNFLKKS